MIHFFRALILLASRLEHNTYIEETPPIPLWKEFETLLFQQLKLFERNSSLLYWLGSTACECTVVLAGLIFQLLSSGESSTSACSFEGLTVRPMHVFRQNVKYIYAYGKVDEQKRPRYLLNCSFAKATQRKEGIVLRYRTTFPGIFGKGYPIPCYINNPEHMISKACSYCVSIRSKYFSVQYLRELCI